MEQSFIEFIAPMAATVIAVALIAILFRYISRKYPPHSILFRFCPRCGSQRIEETKNGQFLDGILYHATPSQLRCSQCGYTSVFFPVADNKEELIKIQKKLKKDGKEKD